MPRSGAKTREKIIDATQTLVYRHGFAATSIDKVVEGAEITKGAFFYHFKSKADLGRALIDRYAERDLAHLDRIMTHAETSSGDPRQQALNFVRLLQEDFVSLPNPIPGCLFTSYLYEPAEYPSDVAEIAARTFEQWRERVAAKFAEAAGSPGFEDPATPQRLANTLLALIEGGFILAKAQEDAKVLLDLLDQFHAQLEHSLLSAGGNSAPRNRGGA